MSNPCITAIALAAVAVGIAPECPAAAAPRRPNIVFAFADDMGRYASAYRAIDGPGTLHDAIRTPNIDRIAREGALFRHAFVNAPSCTPCRSSLLSGQHFWRTRRGAILRGAVWDEAIPAFPLLLRDAGYHIGKTAKVWSPGIPADAPFGGQKYAYQKAGGRFNTFSQNVTALVAAGTTIDAAKQTLFDEVGANFDSFLAARKPDQPFCYWFGPTNIHRKWVKGSGRGLWNIDPESFEGKLPPFLPDVPEVREDLADYFGEIQAFDGAVGVLLQRLEAAGELDNTLVVVSGDHGPPGFPYGKCTLYDFGTRVTLAIRGAGTKGGRVIDDFVSLPDLAPTFLELAGVDRPDVMTARSLVNVLRSDKEGQVDPARTFVLTGRERHVAEARAGFLPYPQRAIRTRDHLYIINFQPDRWPFGDPVGLDGEPGPTLAQLTEDTRATFADMDAGPTKAWLVARRNDPEWTRHYDLAFAKRPREELYDLASDPHQVKNVAADPAREAIRGALHRQLMAELERTGDPRLIDGGAYFETPPLAGPDAAR